jgi:hypothetical protein
MTGGSKTRRSLKGSDESPRFGNSSVLELRFPFFQECRLLASLASLSNACCCNGCTSSITSMACCSPLAWH